MPVTDVMMYDYKLSGMLAEWQIPLSGALSSIIKDKDIATLPFMGERAERLSVDDFVKLTSSIE